MTNYELQDLLQKINENAEVIFRLNSVEIKFYTMTYNVTGDVVDVELTE